MLLSVWSCPNTYYEMPLIGTADKFRKMGDLFWPLVIVLLLIELLGLSFTIHIIYTFVFLF